MQRREDGRWRRVAPPSGARTLLRWADGDESTDLAPGASRSFELPDPSRLPPGRYRVTVAVIDGEERSGVYEFDIPDRAVSSVPGSEQGGSP